MTFTCQEQKTCDVLVIGGGGAGLRAAIAAASAGADVLMVSKTRMGYASNTYLSKAIVASSGWGTPQDSSDVHKEDTRAGGRYLNDPAMVARFTEKIPSETRQLMAWGAAFGCDEDGTPKILKVPGHTCARHLFGKNLKGSDLVLPLRRKALEKGVRFQERYFVTSLLLSKGGICGATAVSLDGTFLLLQAKTVVLATGGFGHVFLNTNNAPGITGDGQALAFNAGVALQDMEFIQFYPTALGSRGSRLLLYERILMQEGVALKNETGENIIDKYGYSSPQEITRDQLAQIMMTESLATPGKSIFMDLSGLSREKARELSALIPADFFKGKHTFPVIPTTHFCMGGVVSDANCETSCSGLFAAGEVCGGGHGANRIGGNALAEVIAMGSLAGEAAAQKAEIQAVLPSAGQAADQEKIRLEVLFKDQGEIAADLTKQLKETMWVHAGIIRSHKSLKKALSVLEGLKTRTCRVASPSDLIRFLEFRNMLLMGEIICRSALERTESRGSHFRSDFPEENDKHWLVNLRVTRMDSGQKLDKVRVG